MLLMLMQPCWVLDACCRGCHHLDDHSGLRVVEKCRFECGIGPYDTVYLVTRL